VFSVRICNGCVLAFLQVMFGTTAGKVIVMSSGGTMIAQVIIHEGLEITYLGWSSERFYLMDRDADAIPVTGDDITPCTISFFSVQLENLGVRK